MAEGKFYYSGLYSSHMLVYRTGTTPWTMPTGPKAYRQRKELRPVFHHKIDVVWEQLSPKVCQLLDSERLLWTSIDVVRFKVGEGPVGPVVLWIGVVPETLSSEDARISANGCLRLIQQFGIDDVEVEFRGSIYTRSASPSLLKHVSNLHPTVDVRGALTPVLGPSIAAQDTLTPRAPVVSTSPKAAAARKSCSSRLAMSSSRRVRGLAHTKSSAGRRNVVLLGTRAFDDLIKFIKISIGRQGVMVELMSGRWRGCRRGWMARTRTMLRRLRWSYSRPRHY